MCWLATMTVIQCISISFFYFNDRFKFSVDGMGFQIWIGWHTFRKNSTFKNLMFDLLCSNLCIRNDNKPENHASWYETVMTKRPCHKIWNKSTEYTKRVVRDLLVCSFEFKKKKARFIFAQSSVPNIFTFHFFFFALFFCIVFLKHLICSFDFIWMFRNHRAQLISIQFLLDTICCISGRYPTPI